MPQEKNIFVIIGSASKHSANEQLMEYLEKLTEDFFRVTIFADLKTLPPFDPQLSTDHPPKEIITFRNSIEKANGIVICTPEYIFSIPSGLKNAIEWCVATTVWSDKPLGIITASAHGQRGHEELQLIMKTVMAKFTDETTLLIQGIKGKINSNGQITHEKTKDDFANFIHAFKGLINQG